jgi:spore maturation protein CgeB
LLLLGSFEVGAIERYFLKELRKLPMEVQWLDVVTDYYNVLNRSLLNKVINKLDCNILLKGINTRIYQQIVGKEYDIILVIKGSTLWPDTLRQLKNHCKILCCYSPDHPYEFYSEGAGNNNIKNSISLYDLYFTYSHQIATELKKLFKVHTYVIPFGFDDSMTPALEKINELKDSFVFVGSFDRERYRWLEQVKSSRLVIYGERKWSSRTFGNSKVNKSFKGYSVLEQELVNTTVAAKAMINLLRKQNLLTNSHNMRTFEVPGYGGLLISQRTEEQMDFFKENVEALYFDSVEELNEKMEYLEKHPEQVLKVKRAGKLKSISADYSYRRRMRDFYEHVSKYLI